MAGDEQYVFGADAADRLTAWRTASGEIAWTTDSLLYRGLSAPLSAGRTLVFGDAEGMVHWLSRDKGEPLLRLTTDGSAVVTAPRCPARRCWSSPARAACSPSGPSEARGSCAPP